MLMEKFGLINWFSTNLFCKLVVICFHLLRLLVGYVLSSTAVYPNTTSSTTGNLLLFIQVREMLHAGCKIVLHC